MPKYSIIVGLYNHRNYLPVLIEALKQQTIQDFEVHFCDDISTDSTQWFFKNKPNLPFKWHYHRRIFKNGMELGKNLNQGIRKANGQYCVFIMGDSYPNPNFLELVDQNINPDVMVCGIRQHIDEEEDLVVDVDYRLREELIPPFTTLLPKDAFKRITGNGLVVPTEALREVGGWPEIKGYGGDDNILVTKLILKGYLVMSVPQVVIYHFYHKPKELTKKNKDYVSDTIDNLYFGFPRSRFYATRPRLSYLFKEMLSKVKGYLFCRANTKPIS